MRLLVCGSRDYSDRRSVFAVLDRYLAKYGEKLIVIEGEARGADTLARLWAEDRGLAAHRRIMKFPAHWRHTDACEPGCRELVGKGAGPRRNRQMLAEGMPDGVIAFHRDLPAGVGTLDMVDAATRANRPVLWVRREGDETWVQREEVAGWVKAARDRKKAS